MLLLTFKLAMRPWRLAPLSQVFSAIVVGFLLLLAGFSAWLQEGLRPVLARMGSEQVITAYLNPDLPAAEELRVVTGIRDTLEMTVGAQAIREVKLVGPKEFVEQIGKRHPELATELTELGTEMDSVVPRYVSAIGLFSDSALSGVRQIRGIESAESSLDRNRSVFEAFVALRRVARWLAVGLCLALLTGLFHLARMNADLHRESVAVLRLWGAHDLLLRAPGALSGFWVGALGGVLGCVGWLTGGVGLARQVRSLSPSLAEMPLGSAEALRIGLLLCVAGAIIGALAGMLSSAERTFKTRSEAGAQLATEGQGAG